MKSIFVLSSLLFLPAHSDPWTLRAAQEKMLQGNPDLRIQKGELQKNEAQLGEARSAYWPSLDLSGSYQAFTEKNRINLALPAPLPSVDKPLGDYDREEYGIDLTYPLFLGGKSRQQVEARRASLEAQIERLHALQNQMSLRLALQFFAWNMAEVSRQTQETIVGYHREYLSHMSALVKAGTALASRESSAKARLMGAEVDLSAATDTRDSIGRAAALMLGLSPDEPFAFSVDYGAIDSGKAPSQTRPELAMLEKTSVSLTHQEKALSSENFPTLVGLVGYRVANPGLNLGSNDYMNYGLLGIQLRWNLFDGFRNQSQRAETRAEREEIQVEQERQNAFYREARLSAEKWMARLKQAEEAAKASLDATHLALTETQTRRDHGAATDAELLDARILETKNSLQLSQIKLQQQVAQWQWRFARGEDLKFQGE